MNIYINPVYSGEVVAIGNVIIGVIILYPNSCLNCMYIIRHIYLYVVVWFNQY